ncbi:MAG: helix-turn-helix domain-containing protein [Nocardioides sp.]|nr:helix-turn-helix domain-containing protein [Nocardioides sp.]
MTSTPRSRTAALRLPDPVVTAMRDQLPGVAEQVIDAVMAEVPSYSEPFRGRMGRNIEFAVTTALDGFLDMAASSEGFAFGRPLGAVFEAAYELGRGEARSGRSMDALASAYRVGARTAWRDMSALAVAAGLPADDVARFAELVFDFIDQLSGASVSGHTDESDNSGRRQQRRLEQLTASLLAGASEERLLELADRADWVPPLSLTAVLLPTSVVGEVRSRLDGRTLRTGEVPPGMEDRPDLEDLTVLLVPDSGGGARAGLVQVLAGRGAVVGPARSWEQARASYLRALQVCELGVMRNGGSVDAEDHLADVVVHADPVALAELRARALAPLEGMRPATVEKLVDTLRAWLLHQGRREDVAAALFVHPQTVRYRMGQLRERYGDRLDDPSVVRDLVVALGPGGPGPGPVSGSAPRSGSPARPSG